MDGVLACLRLRNPRRVRARRDHRRRAGVAASPDSEELFLAGRSLGVGVVGLSLFASNISSTTMIGLPGAAWASGISGANYEWMAALVLAFIAVFIAPLMIQAQVTTIPELFGRRFSPAMRAYLSVVTLFLSLVLDTAGSLYAGALVLKLFFPDLQLAPMCAAIALFAGLYTAAGGLRAVAYTDVVQALVLLVGSLILAILVFGEFGYSWSAVVDRVDPEKLLLIRPLADPALPWFGTLIGLPVLGFYYWTMNQYVSQRLLGARDARTAGRGALLAAILKLQPLFLHGLPGCDGDGAIYRSGAPRYCVSTTRCRLRPGRGGWADSCGLARGDHVER